jgi:hypothetical protein
MLPDRSHIGALVMRYARLLHVFSADFGERPLVLPTGEFFPDHFTGDAASLERLLRRMQVHAGMSDVPMSAAVAGSIDAEMGAGGSCSSGACKPASLPTEPVARVVDLGDSWLLNVPAPELAIPEVMTTHLARSLGYVFLEESRPTQMKLEAPVEVSAELAGLGLGFGVLLLAGAHVYRKSCGGPSVQHFTVLETSELAVLTAVFIEYHGLTARAALRELAPTQQDALAEALELVHSNQKLVERLKSDPERVARGDYRIAEPRPWLARVLGIGASKEDRAEDDVAALEAELRKERTLLGAKRARPDPERDELRALVDESFGKRGADAE